MILSEAASAGRPLGSSVVTKPISRISWMRTATTCLNPFCESCDMKVATSRMLR
ncbi:hypothetical protein D3C83_82730 [compost metagenome]